MKTPPINSAPTQVPLFCLLLANGCSLVGSQLTALAVPWLVLQLTGSATLTGIVAFANTLPAVLAGFFGGTLVDKFGFKRVSVLADILSAISVALIPLLFRTGSLDFRQLIALVFLRSLLDTPGATARRSLIPDLATIANWQLERVNAAVQATGNLASLLGPALAGFLIATLGTNTVLLLDSITFAFSAVVILIAVPHSIVARNSAKTTEKYMDGLRVGVNFVRREPVILTLMTIVSIINFLGAPLFAVILPVYVLRVYGNAVNLGLIIAGFGGGALIGTLVFGAIGHSWPRRTTLVIAFLVSGLPFWLLIIMPHLFLTIAALAVVGIAVGVINPLLSTVFQERTPKELRGRVFGVLTALGGVATPLGMLVLGALLTGIGLRETLGLLATCYALITIAHLTLPTFRSLQYTYNRRV